MEKKIEKLHSLEAFVINRFLKRCGRKEIPAPEIDAIYVADRSYSKMGFFTHLEKSTHPRVLKSGENFTGCDLVVRLNDLTDTGYVLYIQNGYLETLEGYTWDCFDWPESVDSFQVEKALASTDTNTWLAPDWPASMGDPELELKMLKDFCALLNEVFCRQICKKFISNTTKIVTLLRPRYSTNKYDLSLGTRHAV